MDENKKNQLVKKLCLPINVGTVILSIEFLIFLLRISEMVQVTVQMYNTYNQEIPTLVNGLSNIINIFQSNILRGVILSLGIIGIIVGINVLWKYIAKKIINNSNLDTEVLEKKVDKFKTIATISISLVLIIVFSIIYIGSYKALVDIYTNSFVFEASSM